MFRLIVCILAMCGLNGILYNYWSNSHHTAFVVASMGVPWWLLIGAVFFGLCWIKVKA